MSIVEALRSLGKLRVPSIGDRSERPLTTQEREIEAIRDQRRRTAEVQTPRRTQESEPTQSN